MTPRKPLPEGLHDVALSRLKPSDDNPRAITDEDLEALQGSLKAAPDMLKARPIIALPDGRIVGGEQRWRALKAMGEKRAPAFVKDLSEKERREWMLRDNNGFGDWIEPELAGMIADLQAQGSDTAILGFNAGEVDRLMAQLSQPGAKNPGPSLADRFLIPPFTTFDARQGYWRDRDRAWIGLGIQSEVGRAKQANAYSTSGWDSDYYRRKTEAEKRIGRELSNEEFRRDHYTGAGVRDLATLQISTFSPTLCEIVYRWFSPPAGHVLDPFAGGSVRGIVAAKLGRQYTGVDLSQEQVDANREQAATVIDTGDYEPRWIVGDARDVLTTEEWPGPDADLMFTCPPYFDLERYSDDERDLSTMDPQHFAEVYRVILTYAVERLADDRFAAIVVGDHRQGHRQLSLVADTIRIMEDAGAMHYNHAILLTQVGSAAVRAARSFKARKLTRTHQHVLIFCKGDPVKATAACGDVEIDNDAFSEAGPIEVDDDEAAPADD